MSLVDTMLPVLQIVMAENPSSILDVGCGDGLYGSLFRRRLADANVTIGRGYHKRDSWQIQIDAIEIWEKYITSSHLYDYNNIYITDVFDSFDRVMKRKYDVIFLGDVIEHFRKIDGQILIKKFQSFLNNNGLLLIVTPNYKTQWQKTVNENPYEAHLSLWKIEEFDQFVPPYGSQEGRIIGKKLLIKLRRTSDHE